MNSFSCLPFDRRRWCDALMECTQNEQLNVWINEFESEFCSMSQFGAHFKFGVTWTGKQQLLTVNRILCEVLKNAEDFFCSRRFRTLRHSHTHKHTKRGWERAEKIHIVLLYDEMMRNITVVSMWTKKLA